MRGFAGLELGQEAVPDTATSLDSRHLLTNRGLAKALFDTVKTCLDSRAFLLRGGTFMDPAGNFAPPSARNNTRDGRDQRRPSCPTTSRTARPPTRA